VNEKPTYAYEIDKTIDSREMRRWVRVGVASIYQVLKRLEEKDLVYSQKEKEGKMPDRKRYYITESGKAALVATSKRLLSDLEWYYLDLNVGLDTCDLLTPEEKADCLNRRLARVQLNKKRLKEMYPVENDIVSKRKKAVIRNLIYFRDAEEKFLREVLQEISMDKSR
jgi:DNA-binding PadR family transcriptional regulator